MIYLGKDPTGVERQTAKTFDTRKEAQEYATKIEGLRNDKKYLPSVARGTFADYLRETWLPTYRTQVRSAYTIEKALGAWIFGTSKKKKHEGMPLLGNKRLRDLTVNDFDRFYAALSERGMRPRRIEHLHGLLRRALKHAVRTGQLPSNPTEFATLPKPDRRAEITCEADEDEGGEVEYLKESHAVRFLETAKTDRWSALWHLLIDAGLRPGEAFALKWHHIDFERRLVKVRGNLSRVRGAERNERGQGWKIMKPKTKSSIGDVPVRATTINELEKWRAKQAEERKRIGSEWKEHGFVFTTEFGSPLGNNMRRAWSRVLRAVDGGSGELGTWGPESEKPSSGPMAERSFTPAVSMYVLRHTCATLLLKGGIPLLEVSRRLRHKSIVITARFYGHLTAEDTTAAPEVLDKLFDRKLTLVA
jgi:integrase